MTSLDAYKVAPLNLIFLIDGDKILTLRRAKNKEMRPGQVSGFGGKIEPGEDLVASARRELLEEAGVEVSDICLRGTLVGILDNGYIYEVYIFVAHDPLGEPLNESDEGTIEWRLIQDFLKDPDIVDDIPLYLEQVIAGKDFYCGIAEYQGDTIISYTDNKSHFGARMSGASKR